MVGSACSIRGLGRERIADDDGREGRRGEETPDKIRGVDVEHRRHREYSGGKLAHIERKLETCERKLDEIDKQKTWYGKKNWKTENRYSK